jgi:predicted MFS family arabinose efflux permease
MELSKACMLKSAQFRNLLIGSSKVELGIRPSLIWLMSVTCGLSVANIYLAHPLLDVIARDLHIQKHFLGSVIGITQVGYGLGLLLIVPLGDLFDRRRLVTAMMVVSCFALFILAKTSNVNLFFFSLALLGVFAVVVQILVAFSATLATPGKSGEVVGKVTSGVVTGILLGRVMAGWMADLFGWRSVYVASALATFLMAVALYCMLPRVDVNRQTQRSSYIGLIVSMFSLLGNSRVLRRQAFLALLIFASFNVLWSSLGLMLVNGSQHLSLTSVGLFGLAGAAGAIGASLSGKLADRGIARRSIWIGLALLLLSWVILGFAEHFLIAAVTGVVLLDFGVQVVHVSNQNIIFDLHADARSRVVAAYMVFYSIGSAIGALASNALHASIGWLGVCGLGAVLSLIALGYCRWEFAPS